MGAMACSFAAVCCLSLVVFLLYNNNNNSSSSSTDGTLTTERTPRYLLSSLRHTRQQHYDNSFKELSNDFPSLEDSLEMARLSGLVYRFKYYNDCNATNSEGEPLLPSDLTCHLYNHDHAQGTQVMVLTSSSKKYIAIVFAGTDDLRTTLTDTDILMKPFGPLDEHGQSILLPGPARVHAGFDNAVFENNLFDRLLNITTCLLKQQPDHRLFTTGHSLGGADAILTAVALAQHKLPLGNKITCINFGCPNVGNEHWRNAVHGLNSTTVLAIWRFVHGWDVVPRLPQYPFTHVGHTLQMNADGMHAYYLHRGNVSLHYASVPLGWSGTVVGVIV